MRLWFVASIGIVLTTPAWAQVEPSYYVFAGAGQMTTASSPFRRSIAAFHIGGGLQATARNGLGGEAELGYAGPWSNGSNGIGVLSLNGLYQFERSAKSVPFFSGGYSIGFRSSAIHFANVGGGLIHWLWPTTALRFEVRDLIREPDNHSFMFRFGLQFR